MTRNDQPAGALPTADILASVGETTFMVEDYVPDRLEFTLATKATSISASAPWRSATGSR